MSQRIASGWRFSRGVLGVVIAASPLCACGGGAQTTVAPARPAVQVASNQTAASTTDAAPVGAPAAITEAPETEAAPAAAEQPREIPSQCEAGVTPCSAPKKFVEQLCHGKYQDLALVMHSKGTPWRRLYVKVEKLEPVNIYEGERSEQWLAFGEEVLVLRTRGPGGGGGVQVSGPTDLDVLRWDGTCATVREELLRPYPTNTSILTPRIAWKYLDSSIQEALLANAVVKRESEKERPACRASNMKSPDAACDKASRKLTDAITVALRGGLDLPTPAKLPSW